MTIAALKQPIHMPNKTFNNSKTLFVYFSCITITHHNTVTRNTMLGNK